jgi:hypothetical protein
LYTRACIGARRAITPKHDLYDAVCRRCGDRWCTFATKRTQTLHEHDLASGRSGHLTAIIMQRARTNKRNAISKT